MRFIFSIVGFGAASIWANFTLASAFPSRPQITRPPEHKYIKTLEQDLGIIDVFQDQEMISTFRSYFKSKISSQKKAPSPKIEEPEVKLLPVYSAISNFYHEDPSSFLVKDIDSSVAVFLNHQETKVSAGLRTPLFPHQVRMSVVRSFYDTKGILRPSYEYGQDGNARCVTIRSDNMDFNRSLLTELEKSGKLEENGIEVTEKRHWQYIIDRKFEDLWRKELNKSFHPATKAATTVTIASYFVSQYLMDTVDFLTKMGFPITYMYFNDIIYGIDDSGVWLVLPDHMTMDEEGIFIGPSYYFNVKSIVTCNPKSGVIFKAKSD